jgi:hypothetical protein
LLGFDVSDLDRGRRVGFVDFDGPQYESYDAMRDEAERVKG